MTKTELTARLDALKNDLYYWVDDANIYHVDIRDYDGFDENWDEIDRELDDAPAVDALLDDLANSCESVRHGFRTYYIFPGFGVSVGYESADI